MMKSSNTSATSTKIDLSAPGLFLAGQLFVFEGDDRRQEIAACYKPNNLSSKSLDLALTSYKAGDISATMDNMSKV